MHGFFIVLLVGVLIASVISLVAMGWLQHRRTNALARKAHEMSMHFSPSDIFDIGCTYRNFALITSGHSPRIENVTYGRIKGKTIRAFDFRYEIGHSMERLTKHYYVIVVETQREMAKVIMWHEADASAEALSLPLGDQRVEKWLYRGSTRQARSLARLGESLGCEVNMQVLSNAVMLAIPARPDKKSRKTHVPDVAAISADVIRSLSELDTVDSGDKDS